VEIKTNEGKQCYRFSTGRDRFNTRENIISIGGDNSLNEKVNKIKMVWDNFFNE